MWRGWEGRRFSNVAGNPRRAAVQHMLCWIQTRDRRGQATLKGRGGHTQSESSAVYLLCGLLSQKTPSSSSSWSWSWSSLPPHDVLSAVTSLPLCWDKAAVVMCCRANMHAASDQRPGSLPALLHRQRYAEWGRPQRCCCDSREAGNKKNHDTVFITQARHMNTLRYVAKKKQKTISLLKP